MLLQKLVQPHWLLKLLNKKKLYSSKAIFDQQVSILNKNFKRRVISW